MAEARDDLQQQRLREFEMQRRGHETESRSVEENKGPTPDMKLSDSWRRCDERTDRIQKTESKDKEESFLRINEAGQIRGYKYSNEDTRENPQNQRIRSVEMQRSRRETESRFWHQERNRSPDRRGSEFGPRFDERAPDCRENESRWRFCERTPDWRGSESRLLFEQRTHELVHPTQLPHVLPDKIGMPICRHFKRGYCMLGSVCKFQHIKNRDGVEPMYQARTWDWRGNESEWRFDERTQRRSEIEYSGFRPEKRDRSPDPRRFGVRALDWGDSKSDGRDYGRSPEYRRNETEWRDYERSPEYRRNETECRYDERSPEYKRNETEWGYDERSPEYRRNETEWRYDERSPGYRKKETECRYDDRSPEYRRNETEWRYDERSPEYRKKETECRYDERSPEYRRNETEWRYDERSPEYRRNETEWRYNKRTRRRFERLESGGNAVHPGKDDCFTYFQTGQCRKGRNVCKFNHPTTLPQELPDKTVNVPVCKYFLYGHYMKGSDCVYPHTMMDRDSAEPMHQGRPMDRRASEPNWGCYERELDRRVSDSEWIFDERTDRRYETDSGYRPEKRSRRETFKDIRQRRLEIEREYEEKRRVEIPTNPFMAAQRERERREAQDDMQEQRSGGRIINLSHLINPIANEILRERKRNREVERLSMKESTTRSSQQSNSIN